MLHAVINVSNIQHMTRFITVHNKDVFLLLHVYVAVNDCQAQWYVKLI